MRKEPKNMAPGDWALTEATLSGRYVGSPWQVTSVVKSRVYVQQWRFDAQSQTNEIYERKYFATKSILYVFSTPQEAQRVSDLSRYLNDRLDKQIRDLEKANRKEFDTHLRNIAVGAEHHPDCEHEWDPLTANSVYQCCKKCGFVQYESATFSPWTGLAPD